MRDRSFILLAVTVAALLFGAVAVYAYDNTREDLIAEGVSAGGIDLGGMTETEAREKLRVQLQEPLRKPVVVTYSGRRYKLTAKKARVSVDTDAMVDRAVEASREGNLIARTTRALTGSRVDEDIPVTVDYDRRAVKQLVARVKAKVNQPARDAELSFAGGRLGRVPSQDGRKVRTARLERDVAAELTQPAADRRIKARVSRTRAKITAGELEERYPTVIMVDRDTKQLRLYKRLKLVKTYRIAVGQAGMDTPAGRYTIQDKQVNPFWHVPKRAWAGKLAGRTIPPGPQNPLKARWMGIYNGAGIHGTADTGSLGSAASHGCIRMAVPDVVRLFERVDVGDPVYIS